MVLSGFLSCLWALALTVSRIRAINTLSITLPSVELAALYDLYESTEGDYWLWRTPYSANGYPWSFAANGTALQNPCGEDMPWQGVACSSNCSVSPCAVTQLLLVDMPLYGESCVCH